MKNIFTLKEFPFLLTILFGLIGYQVNNITNSIIDSPCVEYGLNEISSRIENDTICKDYECLITNITSHYSFTDLTINFLCPENNSFRLFDPKTISVPPSSQHYGDPKSLDNELLVFEITTLQPGDKYQLLFKSKASIKDLKSKPSLYLTAKGNIRIIKKSLSTWFVKNFIEINIALIFLWIIMIALYFKFLK